MWVRWNVWNASCIYSILVWLPSFSFSFVEVRPKEKKKGSKITSIYQYCLNSTKVSRPEHLVLLYLARCDQMFCILFMCHLFSCLVMQWPKWKAKRFEPVLCKIDCWKSRAHPSCLPWVRSLVHFDKWLLWVVAISLWEDCLPNF